MHAIGPLKGHYGGNWYTWTLFATRATRSLLLFLFQMIVGLLCWMLVLASRHGALLSQGLNVSISAQTMRLLPFLPHLPPEDFVGNPLLCLRETRKEKRHPELLRLEAPPGTPNALIKLLPNTTALETKKTMGHHWVNRTHTAFVGGTNAFDTERFAEKGKKEHFLHLLNILDGGGVVAGMQGTFHHDMRFYSETQTFFALTRDKLHQSDEVVDTLSEVDLEGSVLWSWYPRDSKDLPHCMKWELQNQNSNDCHHINTVHYVHDEQMIYLSMRRLAGFVALHKPTNQIQWIFTNRRLTPGFQRTAVWIDVCEDHIIPWPRDTCENFGFHSLHVLRQNLFSVFANCDCSVRVFRIRVNLGNKFCLEPVHYISGPEVGERRAHGIAYPLPHNKVLLSSRDQEYVMWSHSARLSLLGKERGYWCDPTYVAPFLNATVVQGKFPLVEVIVAHHLWVPTATTGKFTCSSSHPNAIICPNVTVVTLAAWMRPRRFPLHIMAAVPWASLELGLHIHGSSNYITLDLEIS